MKKILSLLVMLIAFCAVSFAQSAPKVASEATLLQNGTKVKNSKTGEVRIAKGTVPTTVPNGKLTITKSAGKAPTKSKKSSGNLSLKQLPNNAKLLKKLDNQ